jgi:hypothetical protein
MSKTLTKARVAELAASIRWGKACARDLTDSGGGYHSCQLGSLQAAVRQLVCELAGSEAAALIEAEFVREPTDEEVAQNKAEREERRAAWLARSSA